MQGGARFVLRCGAPVYADRTRGCVQAAPPQPRTALKREKSIRVNSEDAASSAPAVNAHRSAIRLSSDQPGALEDEVVLLGTGAHACELAAILARRQRVAVA